jgi:predicted dehydrogenase
MLTRRTFVKQVAAGAAAYASYSLAPAGRVLGANDRVRFALIGAGSRGKQIFKAALGCPNVEAVAVADIYSCRLDEAKQIAPNVNTYQDFHKILDDKSIDAVLIATPQHQHVLNFVPALQAGKDVYQEKTMAFNPDHARRMRKAFEGSSRVVQIGIQSTSGPAEPKARELSTPERMGVITALHTHHYRNAPYGGWLRKIPPDCDLQHVDWKAFEGEADHYAFDPERYINWRFYWDYSGGNVFENMVHQVGFWYKALGLKIPDRVTMTGDNYLSPKMQVPDTMNATMHQPEKMLFTWSSMFGNNFYHEGEDLLLGNKGTLVCKELDELRYMPQARHGAEGASEAANTPPDATGIGDSGMTKVHMQNFFDCVRSRQEPNCPFELGFRSAITCQMANASYRLGRTVQWDESRQDIV